MFSVVRESSHTILIAAAPMITTVMINQIALDFYNQNKDCTWTKEEIPVNLTTNIEKANWILNQSDFGWIELDLDIDAEAWKKDAEQATSFFVPHREEESQGWNSCCIHGISIDRTGAWTQYGYTDEAMVPYNWTLLATLTHKITKFWKDQFPSDKYRRIRFMELEPISAITPHSDMPGRLPGEENFNALEFGVPVNIAVVHPEDCHMVLQGKGIVPFKEGRAFIINIRHYHSVINFSTQNRIHVIGHSYGYGSKLEKFADLVVRSYEKMQSIN